eukprot:s4_g30.t1
MLIPWIHRGITAWTPAFVTPEGKRRSMVLLLTILPSSAMAAMDPKQQVTAAMQKLEELCDPENYKKVASGGGDNIRREVGTVGVTSPLFDVDKAFKALAEEADDPEAYVEVYIDKAFEELQRSLKLPKLLRGS